jgi:hypothetical protein
VIFGGVFRKAVRLPAKPRDNNNFRKSTIADCGNRLGTLLGTARNHYAKSVFMSGLTLSSHTNGCGVPEIVPPTGLTRTRASRRVIPGYGAALGRSAAGSEISICLLS